MTDFDNGAFMEQLNPEYHSKKKSNLVAYLVVGIVVSTASALLFYFKMKECQEELIKQQSINRID